MSSSVQEDMIIFPNVYTIFPENILSYSVDLLKITNKFYRPYININSPSVACVVLRELIFESGILEKGSVVIFSKKYFSKLKKTDNLIIFYEENYLRYVYNTIYQRLLYGKSIARKYEKVNEEKCIQNYMNMKIIGKGTYGNVFKTQTSKLDFAIKFTKMKSEDFMKKYENNLKSWHDRYILKFILNKIVEKKICPNLPYMYKDFTCDKCSLVFNDKKSNEPCTISFIELANGDLSKYLKQKRDIEELECCLFQIMAGLHAIQKYGEIWHFDIKAENVLFYETEKNGYWKYTIRGKDYYIPNMGIVFVLNDFGVSRVFSKKLFVYSNDDDKFAYLGSRHAYIKNGKFKPINTKKQFFAEIMDPQEIEWDGGVIKSTGSRRAISRETNKIIDVEPELSIDVFKDPEVTPPFEFYNDLQDVLKIFLGGKKATQKGNHKDFGINETFKESLENYIGVSKDYKECKFSTDPSQLLASYFIESYFEKYRVKKDDVLESYIMS